MKIWDLRHGEGNIMSWTPLNHLCFLAYLFFGSPITFGSLLQAKYEVLGLSQRPKSPKKANLGVITQNNQKLKMKIGYFKFFL